jgi:hypothetical protein
MPKRKLPTTLKLSFQEKHPSYSYQGKQVRYMDAVQFLIERFFSKPLPQRLDELSDRLEKTNAGLAQNIRQMKAQVEQLCYPSDSHRDDYTGLDKDTGLPQFIDLFIEKKLLEGY